MADIDAVRDALHNWAIWVDSRERGALGYPRINLLARSGGRSASTDHIPVGIQQAELMDGLVQRLRQAFGSASIMPSTPPHTAKSASPMTICRQAWAMASEPDEHAETGVMTPARAPRSRPTTAAAPLGMII